MQVFVKPLVNLIWVAGFVFVAGALIAMWPDAVEQRRLAARDTARAAPAGMAGRSQWRRCSRSSPSSSWRGPSSATRRLRATGSTSSRPRRGSRLALAEERDRALAALKELEFDHRTGKISDEDYRAQAGPLRRRAAEVLRALEGGEQARHERIADRGQRVP